MVLTHVSSSMASCAHGVGSAHAQVPRPRSAGGKGAKATPLARRTDMRRIIIILIVRLLCVYARHKVMVGRGSGDSQGGVGLSRWICMGLSGVREGACGVHRGVSDEERCRGGAGTRAGQVGWRRRI